MKDKRNKLEGLLLIDKPEDWTSHDCVAVVRRASGMQKVGHTGTLDPNATGVLVLALGKATRIIEYLEMDSKVYEGSLIVGIETDTEDIWGRMTEINEDVLNISRAMSVSQDSRETYNKYEKIFEAAKDKFVGKISQSPPMYSAIQVNGRRLYSYARAGETVEVKKREIEIYSLEFSGIHPARYKIEGIEGFLNFLELNFIVECSKGTYIRSLCRDLGRETGCLATMSSLRRIKCGTLDGTGIDPRDIKGKDISYIEPKILPMEYALDNLGRIDVEYSIARDIVIGKKIKSSECTIKKEPVKSRYYCVFFKDKILSVGYFEENIFCSHKVLRNSI